MLEYYSFFTDHFGVRLRPSPTSESGRSSSAFFSHRVANRSTRSCALRDPFSLRGAAREVTLHSQLPGGGRLEGAVRARYGLKKVLLVPGDPEILEDLDQQQRRSVQRQVLRSMAQRFAEHFDALLAAAAARQRAAVKAGREAVPIVVGVAWGRTMHLLARHLLSTPRPLRLAELHVVPIVGITSALRADPVEANVVAMDFPRAYRGPSPPP